MPAPHGQFYPWRDSGNIGCHRMSISGVIHGRKYIFANVRDHRWLPVARPMPGEERTQAWGVTRVAIRWIALFACFRSYRD
jgi:hypothetical protein